MMDDWGHFRRFDIPPFFSVLQSCSFHHGFILPVNLFFSWWPWRSWRLSGDERDGQYGTYGGNEGDAENIGNVEWDVYM